MSFNNDKNSKSNSNSNEKIDIKQKGITQKVRFPKDNNPKSLEVHLPTDDTNDVTIGSDIASSSHHSKTAESQLHTSRNDDSENEDDGEDFLQMKPVRSILAKTKFIPTRPSEDPFSDGYKIPSSYDGQSPFMSRESSSQNLLGAASSSNTEQNNDFDDIDNADLASLRPHQLTHTYNNQENFRGAERSDLTASVLANAAGVSPDYLNVGLITPGGLAPGSTIDNDARVSPSKRSTFSRNMSPASPLSQSFNTISAHGSDEDLIRHNQRENEANNQNRYPSSHEVPHTERKNFFNKTKDVFKNPISMFHKNFRQFNSEPNTGGELSAEPYQGIQLDDLEQTGNGGGNRPRSDSTTEGFTSKQVADAFAKSLVRAHSKHHRSQQAAKKDSTKENSMTVIPTLAIFDDNYLSLPVTRDNSYNNLNELSSSKDTHQAKSFQEKGSGSSETSSKNLENSEASNRNSNNDNNNSSSNNNNKNDDDDEEKNNTDRNEDERDRALYDDYIPPPKHVKQGVLGSLLKLYKNNQQQISSSTPTSGGVTPGTVTPGAVTPTFEQQKLKSNSSSYDNLIHAVSSRLKAQHKKKPSGGLSSSKSAESSSASINELVSSSSNVLKIPMNSVKASRSNVDVSSSSGLLSPGTSSPPNGKPSRPKYGRQHSGALEAIRKAQNERKRRKMMEEEERRIALHIADVLQRQRFVLRLCRALMLYGAPTHRLEEYMVMTSRALDIDGQYIYIPGCMICAFGDSSTHTSEMQLVRVIQGVNLSKLHIVHSIYKKVIHGKLNVEHASTQIDQLLNSKNKYPTWFVVLIFALSSTFVAPFGFGGKWLDMPMCFLLGGSVGVLQIVVAPRSGLYNNVFEVTSSIIVSFLGRAFGSIGSGNQQYFCFSAIVQASLALILPGYIILCGSLELQSKNIVSGSVRMFYAIIYSLLLGFGITLGSAIYGWIDPGAVSEVTCPSQLNPWWRFLFVPLFTIGLALVNQSSLRQLPPMVVISGAGYAAQYFANKRLTNASGLTSAIGAFVIGILGNMYSRIGHGLAFAAMLPAIFVQVPSGVAAQGSLMSGIENANSIVTNTTQPQTSNGTLNLQSLNVGMTMIQVSIGISVGLFVATLVVYPFGKTKSGLFTF